MKIGKNAARNIGVRYMIIMKIEMTLKNDAIQLLIFDGKVLSRTWTSFENRFIIRPIGVVSKNTIGRCKVCCSRLLWKSWHALRHPRTVIIALIRYETALKKNN